MKHVSPWNSLTGSGNMMSLWMSSSSRMRLQSVWKDQTSPERLKLPTLMPGSQFRGHLVYVNWTCIHGVYLICIWLFWGCDLSYGTSTSQRAWWCIWGRWTGVKAYPGTAGTESSFAFICNLFINTFVFGRLGPYPSLSKKDEAVPESSQSKVVQDLDKCMDALNLKMASIFDMVALLGDKENPPPMDRYTLFLDVNDQFFIPFWIF